METTMPLTAKDALALWDSGEAVPAFQVETTPERQTEVYGAAFDLLRGEYPIGTALHDRQGAQDALAKWKLSDRELEVAHSIAHVATQSGWAKMVSQHVHRDSPAITVRKPA